MDNTSEKLLSDRRVIEEIHRHLWLESEKAGYNIGFEKAKEDWLKRFSKAWMEYNMPECLTKTDGQNQKTTPVKIQANELEKNSAAIKRRRAKSYIVD